VDDEGRLVLAILQIGEGILFGFEGVDEGGEQGLALGLG
jgi:hypothetical protein